MLLAIELSAQDDGEGGSVFKLERYVAIKVFVYPDAAAESGPGDGASAANGEVDPEEHQRQIQMQEY